MQNIATSKLSIININNKTSTNPLSDFQFSRAQNRGFCAILAFGTPVFGHFEHKIGIFVLEQRDKWHREA